MGRHPHVPDELRTHPFRGRDAVASGLLTRHQLRSTAWTPLIRGIYAHRDLAMDAATRLAALQLVLRPDDVLAGRTAAWVHGCWQPRPGRPVPWNVTRAVRRSGRCPDELTSRRLTLRGSPDWHGGTCGMSVLDQDVVEYAGLSILSPLRTCFDLMRERRLVEAVVVADAFAYAGSLHLTTLAVYASDRRRWPHVREARVAIDLASAGARSPGESRLRMVPVLAGLPEPLVNAPLVDRSGRVIGIPDLTVIRGGRRVGLEYDGAYHDAADQPAADRRRSNRVTLGDLPLLRYDAHSVLHERELVLSEIAAVLGVRHPVELVDRDFARPVPSRAW